MRASTTAESRTKICLVPVKAFNPPPVALTAVRSEAVILLLLIRC